MTDTDIIVEVLKSTRTPQDIRKVARAIARKLNAQKG